MKAFKFYLAADDTRCAFGYKNKPHLTGDIHNWSDGETEDFLHFPKEILDEMGLSTERLLDHPCEIIIVVPGQHDPDDSNQPK